MAAAKRHKRVAATQPGFLPLKADLDGNISDIKRRKRVNRNRKKNWNKYSDIHDVEEFLDDVRLQERATGGLISEKPDDGLFFVDFGEKDKDTQPQEPVKKSRSSKPLRIDLILQPDSHIQAPKNILAFQQPNAKKQRRIANKAAKLAAIGVVSRREKLLQLRMTAATTRVPVKENPASNKPFYDLWTAGAPETADPYYLEQTKQKRVRRPSKLNEKPSILPAVEVVAPGASYNPEFFSHQDLLREAHEVEVKKLKEEERLHRQLAVNGEIATEESTFNEQVEGLIEDDEEEEETEQKQLEEDAEDTAVGPSATQKKKTEKQRRNEKAERIKELQRRAERQVKFSRQQLFQLRSIRVNLKKQEQVTKIRQAQRKARQEAEKSMPRRLGILKFQTPDLDVQLSDELPSSLRSLKPEGSILKDRFKSLQKRNLIEPRERAKFKRRLKLKYTEKRAFREIK